MLAQQDFTQFVAQPGQVSAALLQRVIFAGEQHHDVGDGTPGLVGLYAKLNRMRVLSSKPVVRSAEQIARTIMDAYLEPDKSFGELRDMAKSGSIDLLREFSEACRDEFDEMRDRQL